MKNRIIPACWQGEGHKKRSYYIKKRQKCDIPWYCRINPILVVIFSTCDGLVIKDIVNKNITEDWVLLYVLAGSIALMLNVLPVIAGTALVEHVYKLNRMALLKLLLPLVAFFILFGSTVYLRFANMDMYSPSQNHSIIINSVENDNTTKEMSVYETEVPEGASQKSISIVLLLSLEPLITSLICFSIEVFGMGAILKKIHQYQKERLAIEDMILTNERGLEVMNAQKENYQRSLEELDEDSYEAILQEVDAIEKKLCSIARSMLAQYLKDPEAFSELTSERVEASQTT